MAHTSTKKLMKASALTIILLIGGQTNDDLLFPYMTTAGIYYNHYVNGMAFPYGIAMENGSHQLLTKL
jgi:hypothetical protein